MSLNSLKQKAKQRIQIDMINEVINKSKNSMVLIVLDSKTTKILSSFLKMSELLNQGIFSAESLSISRQPFPKFHVIYFISLIFYENINR